MYLIRLFNDVDLRLTFNGGNETDSSISAVCLQIFEDTYKLRVTLLFSWKKLSQCDGTARLFN
jgi:hypothetical protein